MSNCISFPQRALLMSLFTSVATFACASEQPDRGSQDESRAPILLSAEAGYIDKKSEPFNAGSGVRFAMQITTRRPETKWAPLQSICLHSIQAKKSVCLQLHADTKDMPWLTASKRVLDEEKKAAIQEEWIADAILVDEPVIVDALVRDGTAQFLMNGISPVMTKGPIIVNHRLDFVPDQVQLSCSSADCTFTRITDHNVGADSDGGPVIAAALALELAEKKYGTDAPFLLRLRLSLGSRLEEAGRLEGAFAEYQKSLEIAQRAYGDGHKLLARALDGLASVFARQGKFSKAEPLYLRAVAIYEKLDPDGEDLASELNELGRLYDEQRRDELALGSYQRALKISTTARGADDAETITILHNIASVYESIGKHDEALSLYKRVLAAREQIFGPEHLDVAITLNQLGLAYQNNGDDEKAEPYLRRSLAIRERLLGKNHPRVATAALNLGITQENLGDTEGAITAYRRALFIRELVLGKDHIEVAYVLNTLGNFFTKYRKWEEAEAQLRRALAIEKATFSDDHPSVQYTRSLLRDLTFARSLSQQR